MLARRTGLGPMPEGRSDSALASARRQAPRSRGLTRLGAALLLMVLAGCSAMDSMMPTMAPSSPAVPTIVLRQPPLRRQRSARVGRRRALALRDPRHRRFEIPDLGRLAQSQGERRVLRLHQGDRGRRPRRRLFRRALAHDEGGRHAARGLSLLLLLPPGRRAGALVHPERAEGTRRPAAGARHGVEPPVADLQAAAGAGQSCARR